MSSSASVVKDIAKPPVPAKPGTSVQGSSGPEPSLQTFVKPSTSHGVSTFSHATTPSGQDFSSFYPTGTEDFSQSHAAFSETYPYSFTSPPEPDDVPFSEPQESDPEYSGSVSESEENPEAMDKPEQTEELNYRETVRFVRSYMGWHHIPTFECDLSELDKTNNPWKGKNP